MPQSTMRQENVQSQAGRGRSGPTEISLLGDASQIGKSGLIVFWAVPVTCYATMPRTAVRRALWCVLVLAKITLDVQVMQRVTRWQWT